VVLCQELGLGEELVAPSTNTALIWTRGHLRRLPDDTVLGVPTRLRTLWASKIVSPAGLARAGLDLVLPADASAGDRSVAALIDSRSVSRSASAWSTHSWAASMPGRPSS